MLDYNTWRVSHYVCLYVYICLFIAAVIATASTPWSFPEPRLNFRVPGGAPVLFVPRPSSTSDPESSRQLTGGGIAIAIVGTIAISILFASINHLQKLCDQDNRDRGFYIKIAAAASVAVRVPLVAFEVTMAVATATQIRPVRFALVAYVTLSAIAGFVTLGTLIADIIYLRGLYARMNYTNISNIPPSKIDEDF